MKPSVCVSVSVFLSLGDRKVIRLTLGLPEKNDRQKVTCVCARLWRH